MGALECIRAQSATTNTNNVAFMKISLIHVKELYDCRKETCLLNGLYLAVYNCVYHKQS